MISKTHVQGVYFILYLSMTAIIAALSHGNSASAGKLVYVCSRVRKVRKATVSFVMSVFPVHLFPLNKSIPTERIFTKFDI